MRVIWTGGLPHASKHVNSPTWGPPPPYKQALNENKKKTRATTQTSVVIKDVATRTHMRTLKEGKG